MGQFAVKKEKKNSNLTLFDLTKPNLAENNIFFYGELSHGELSHGQKSVHALYLYSGLYKAI